MSEENVLIIADDNPDYYGKYIAIKDFNTKEVVAFGEDPLKVREEAREKGFENPVITYFPHPDEAFIYIAA